MSLRFNWKVFVLVKLCIVFGSLIASFAVIRIGLGTEEDKRQNTEYDEIKITNEKASRRQYDNKVMMKLIGRRLLEVPGDDEEPNCTMPAIVSFPQTLFTEAQREKGAIIINFLAAIYLFGASSYVCVAYFVPSLEIISQTLEIQEDVAGATFMAIGSSAPEFFASVVGSFVTHDSTGVSAIVGSSAFNVFVIIALCSLAAGRNVGIQLSWYPVIRDSICWFIALIILTVVTYDSFVQWWEGLVMTLIFTGYITIMYFNEPVSAFVLKYCTLCPSRGAIRLLENDDVKSEETAFIDDLSSSEIGSIVEFGTSRTYGTGQPRLDENSSKDVPQEDSDSEKPLPSVFEPPTSTVYYIAWLLGLPVIITLYYTVPDCRKAGVWRRCYPVTFVMSAVWLAGLSYVLYWMIVVIGYTLGVPDIVMGFTVLAIGNSVPDAVSSVMVARDGFGDMAIANIIGSNICVIYICLGFVWFLKSVTSDPVSPVMISIHGLTATTVSLLITFILLIVAIHLNKWKLDMKIGILSLLFYIIFIIWATLNATGTFGEAFSLLGQPVTPLPPCTPSYL